MKQTSKGKTRMSSASRARLDKKLNRSLSENKQPHHQPRNTLKNGINLITLPTMDAKYSKKMKLAPPESNKLEQAQYSVLTRNKRRPK
jgi:hypothetical protein